MALPADKAIAVGLICLMAAAGILYWLVLQEKERAPGAYAPDAGPGEYWQAMPVQRRAVAVLAFVLASWGLGSLLDGIIRALKQRSPS